MISDCSVDYLLTLIGNHKKAIPGIDEVGMAFFVVCLLLFGMFREFLERLFLDRLSRFVFGCSVSNDCIVDNSGRCTQFCLNRFLALGYSIFYYCIINDSCCINFCQGCRSFCIATTNTNFFIIVCFNDY